MGVSVSGWQLELEPESGECLVRDLPKQLVLELLTERVSAIRPDNYPQVASAHKPDLKSKLFYQVLVLLPSRPFLMYANQLKEATQSYWHPILLYSRSSTIRLSVSRFCHRRLSD